MTPFDNVGGLLGLDAEQMKKLIAQYGATPELKSAANNDGLLALGLGLMANARKGREIEGIGNAGMGALAYRDSSLSNRVKEQGQALTQGMAAWKLAKDGAMQDRRMSMLNESDAPPPAPAQFSAPGPAANGFSPQDAAPPSNGINPKNVTQQTLLGRARQLGVEQPVKMALLSDTDPFGKAATIIAEASKPHVLSPGQQLFGVDGTPFASSPNIDKGMQSVGGVVSALPGYSATNAGIEGDKAAAVAAAQAKVDLVAVPDGKGGTIMMPRDQAAQMLRGGGQSQQPPRWTGNRAPTQEEMAWMASQGGAPAGGGATGGVGFSQGPVAEHRQIKAIDTAASQDSEIVKGFATDYGNVVKAEMTAPANIAKFTQLKNYLSQVDTGAAAPQVQTLKSYAAYFAPELTKSWTKDVPYAQAAAAFSNEISLQLRNPAGGAGLPGSMSDSDRNFLVSMTSSNANDPRAIPIMIDARIAMEKRSQEVGKLAREYRQKNGKIDEGFYQELQNYADSHPMFKDAPKQGAVAQAPTGKKWVFDGKKMVLQ